MNYQEVQPFLIRNYSTVNRRIKSESPEGSRYELITKLGILLSEQNEQLTILEVGSFRQYLEKQLFRRYRGDHRILGHSFITLDLADIAASFLFMKQSGVPHTRANALQLPFGRNTFDLVISNLAIDFLPREAFSEVAETLTPSGLALFNFHHPSLTDIEPVDMQQRMFWHYLRSENVLFTSPEHISATLQDHGLSPYHIQLESDGYNHWWFAAAQKIQ